MIKKTRFKDLITIKNTSFKDNRGYLKELLKERELKKFPFTVMSFSKKCNQRFTLTNKKVSR